MALSPESIFSVMMRVAVGFPPRSREYRPAVSLSAVGLFSLVGMAARGENSHNTHTIGLRDRLWVADTAGKHGDGWKQMCADAGVQAVGAGPMRGGDRGRSKELPVPGSRKRGQPRRSA